MLLLVKILSEDVSDEFHHVRCLIGRLPEGLSAELQKTGKTDIIRHRVNTDNHAPHFEQLRRHPTSQLPVTDRHVEEMLQHDVIEPAASPWSSNVVMVKKKDGTVRFYLDDILFF